MSLCPQLIVTNQYAIWYAILCWNREDWVGMCWKVNVFKCLIFIGKIGIYWKILDSFIAATVSASDS